MNPEITIIGAAIIDILVRPVSEQIFQTESYNAEDIVMSTGADALNESVILARMGNQVQLETVIGTDEGGRYLLKRCQEEGIFVPEHCLRGDMPTGINVVMVRENGERSFLTSPKGSLRYLSLTDIQMPFPDSAKIVCFASMFDFPNINAPELEVIFAQAKAQGKILCADMSKRKHGETVEDLAAVFPYVDYLFPNVEEACLLTGVACPKEIFSEETFSEEAEESAYEKAVTEAAEKFMEAGVKNCIIKCGAKGCYVKNAQEAFWVPSEEQVTCLDTTGAGDSFVAGFLHALLKGEPLGDCARFGNHCGARAVGSTGATTWSGELKQPKEF